MASVNRLGRNQHWLMSLGFLLLSLAFNCLTGLAQPALPLDLPQLVVVIIVDGFPAEQLTKYSDQFGPGGLRLLMDEGAWFSDAHFGHSVTVTAAGHATIMTGARPERHGIIGNDWMDRETRSWIYCVEDPSHSYLGEPSRQGAGTSPRNLKVSTLGDELRGANGFSRILAIAGKDRTAILPAGQLGEAYFYSRQSGRFITTNYYRQRYPGWWQSFYSGNPQNRWFSKDWRLLLPEQAYDRSAADNRSHHRSSLGLGKAFPHPIDGGLDQPGPAYYEALLRAPFGDEYTVEFARAAILGESLGKNPRGVPDLLVLGLSSHDYVNHLFGPESRQSHDHLLRLDRVLAELITFLKGWVGLDRAAIILTSDHGFSYSPEHWAKMDLGTGRIDPYQMIRRLNEFLSSEFDPGTYAVSWFMPSIYLDYQLIKRNGLDPLQVEEAAARFLLGQPGIEAVWTRTQLESGQLPKNRLGQQVASSWDSTRSGDLFVVQKNRWYLMGKPDALAAPHGSPYPYDTHVPLLFFGPWFKSGRYPLRVEIVDLAATLAHLLKLELSSQAEGRVLIESLK